MPKVKRRLGWARGVRPCPPRAREAAARGKPRTNKDCQGWGGVGVASARPAERGRLRSGPGRLDPPRV